MSKDFKATIREDSSRAPAWLEVFGSREIPLRSPFPHWASAPDVPAGLFFQLDLGELTPEQRERLVKFIAGKFSVDEQEVASTLDEVGCPILFEDVTVTVFNPQRWL